MRTSLDDVDSEESEGEGEEPAPGAVTLRRRPAAPAVDCVGVAAVVNDLLERTWDPTWCIAQAWALGPATNVRKLAESIRLQAENADWPDEALFVRLCEQALEGDPEPVVWITGERAAGNGKGTYAESPYPTRTPLKPQRLRSHARAARKVYAANACATTALVLRDALDMLAVGHGAELRCDVGGAVGRVVRVRMAEMTPPGEYAYSAAIRGPDPDQQLRAHYTNPVLMVMPGGTVQRLTTTRAMHTCIALDVQPDAGGEPVPVYLDPTAEQYDVFKDYPPYGCVHVFTDPAAHGRAVLCEANDVEERRAKFVQEGRDVDNMKRISKAAVAAALCPRDAYRRRRPFPQ